MAKTRIAIVSFNCNHGLVAQRLHLPLRHLNRDKYEIRCIDISDVRNSDLFYTDVVIMSHPHSPECQNFIERCRMHFGLKVIIDVDDLISGLPIDHPDYTSFSNNRFNNILTTANHVVFSTHFFESYCGHLNRSHSVIENSINKQLIRGIDASMKPYKNAFTVGWTGGQSHRSDQYYTFLDGLREFLRKYDDVKAYFHILCPEILKREFGSQVIFEQNPVDYMDYPAMAASYPMDVCLVGLTDTPFNNCKSDMKLLELAPHGIGLIASPRADFVKHKDKGFMLYADDNNKDYPSWLQQLEYAYMHQDRIKEMAAESKAYVYEHRTSEIACKKWQEVIETVMETK